MRIAGLAAAELENVLGAILAGNAMQQFTEIVEIRWLGVMRVAARGLPCPSLRAIQLVQSLAAKSHAKSVISLISRALDWS
jgi:hypothetical protein